MQPLSESEVRWGRRDRIPTGPGNPTDHFNHIVSLFKWRSLKSGVSEASNSLFETCLTLLLGQLSAASREKPQSAREVSVWSARRLEEKLPARDRNSTICEWDVCSQMQSSLKSHPGEERSRTSAGLPQQLLSGFSSSSSSSPASVSVFAGGIKENALICSVKTNQKG